MLSHRPVPGALFDSPVFPAREMKLFLRHAGPAVAFFHPTQGLLFFSPALRRIWTEARFFAPLSDIEDLTKGDVALAERHHLAAFWEEARNGTAPQHAGRFVLKPGRIHGTNTLGMVFFNFPAGRLLVILAGEAPKTVEKDLEEIVLLNPWDLTSRLSAWVRDSEVECLVGHVLEHFPEEFRDAVTFRRTLSDPDQGLGSPFIRLTYRFLKGRWSREIAPETGPLAREEGRARHYGVLEEGKVLLHFTVFVGGILPLCVAAFPATFLEAERLVRFQRFLHGISNDLVARGRPLVSGLFDFCRHWTGAGFALDSLEELVLLIEPEKGRDLIFLPFWADSSQMAEVREVLDAIRYTTDLLFVDLEKGLGGLLLRNTNRKTAETLVVEKFRQRLPVPVGDPLTVGEFLENH